MNYSTIKTLALSYADREDTEVSNRMDNFLKIVESRINKVLAVREMSVRATVPVVTDQEYYGLPDDFLRMRDLEYQDGSAKTTADYVVPAHMNILHNNGDTTDGFFYTIIANQIQIYPTKSSGNLEMVYMRRVPDLDANNTSNWLSETSPEAYVFGLMVEISSFVKDAEAAMLWDNRFKEALESMEADDSVSRWSGTPLIMRVS